MLPVHAINIYYKHVSRWRLPPEYVAFTMILYYSPQVLMEKLLWLVYVICWGVPIIVMIVTLSEKRYGYNPCGEDGIWYCWVAPKLYERKTDLMVWQLIAGKLWELISYIVVSILYGFVKYQLFTHVSIL